MVPMLKNVAVAMKQWRDQVKAQGQGGVDNLFNVVMPVYAREMVKRGTRPLIVRYFIRLH